MEAWQRASLLSQKVFGLTKSLPRSEDYGLTSQLRRSANSVSANIAEAFGRKSKKDKSNFYIIARGSAYETQSHLIYGVKVGYFDSNQVKQINKGYQNLIHQLNKILKTLKSQSKV